MKIVEMSLALAALGAVATVSAAAAENSGKDELRKSLQDLDEAASWVYDDVDSGFAAARRTAKPLLVVFR